MEYCVPMGANAFFKSSHLLRIKAKVKTASLHPVIIKKSVLNSVEHEFFLLINVKMPTIVGILTFMSRKNSIQGLHEPEKS